MYPKITWCEDSTALIIANAAKLKTEWMIEDQIFKIRL